MSSNQEIALRVLRIGVPLILAQGLVCAKNFEPSVSMAYADNETQLSSRTSSFSATTILLPQDMEDEMEKRVNQARNERGLNLLSRDIRLRDIARSRSLTTSTQVDLSHYLPNGKLAFEVELERVNYGYSLAGENLSRTFIYYPSMLDSTFAAWMDSPDHQANILGRSFARIGVGYSFSDNQCYFAMIVAAN